VKDMRVSSGSPSLQGPKGKNPTAHAGNQQVAKNFAGLVKECGLSRIAVAKLLCVDARTIHRWCASPNEPSFRIVPFTALELLRRMIISGELKEPAHKIPLAMLPRKITR